MKTTLPTYLEGLPAFTCKQPREINHRLCSLVLGTLANDLGTEKKPHPDVCLRAAFWGTRWLCYPMMTMTDDGESSPFKSETIKKNELPLGRAPAGCSLMRGIFLPALLFTFPRKLSILAVRRGAIFPPSYMVSCVGSWCP